jgi:hypothetical protein
VEPQGCGHFATPRSGSRADGRKGWKRTGRGELTPQRIPSAPRTPPGRPAPPPPPPKQKGQAAGGGGAVATGRCACALGGRQRCAAREAGAISGSPSPEVKGLPVGALRWGRGRRERGLRAPLEPLTPSSSKRGRLCVEAALTAAAAAASFAAATTA